MSRNWINSTMDPNIIRRKCKILKYFTLSEQKIRTDIERIQEKLDSVEWTEETYSQRINLYRELGTCWEMYRIDRVRIKWYKDDLLKKANLTG